jgi:LPS sulfotransferase NodH
MDSAVQSVRTYRPFIILARSRTGSNLLKSYLSSHPNIRVHGEVFRRLNGRNHKHVLEQLFCQQSRNVGAVGFKAFYYHPLDDTSGTLWKQLLAMPDLAVIHLQRRNILRTLISKQLALVSNVWEVSNHRPLHCAEKGQVEFTAEQLQAGFEQTRCWQIQFREMFQRHDNVEVTYEELCREPQRELRKILKFLDLPFQPLQTGLEKQNPEITSELLKNYAELKQAFAGTQWQEFFECPG